MTESTWSIKLESEKKILWTGSTKISPDISKLSQLLPITLSFNDLTAITVQILTSAPLDKIPTLLTALCSVYLRSPTTGAIDMNALSSIAATEHRMVCGRVFKKGDIVWNCRTCGKDPTCVQCDPCFRKSNHTGHEVYFHRAEGGSGCCDCGDLEAWAVHGCCSDHQVKEHSDDYDPAAHLPEEVKKGFRAVLQACFGWISSYLIFTVRSFEPFPDNMILQLLRDHYPTKSVVLRIHNDDVHTYEEVTQTFRSVGFTSQIAQDLTKQVDKEGNAIILNINVANERLDEVYNIITNAGLIYSIYPIELLSIEKRIPVILTSLITLGEFSDGFRRIISEELLRSVTSSVTSNIAIYSWPELLTSFTLQTMFEAEGQFPLEITQLSSIEFLSLSLSGNISHSPSNATTTSTTTENELKDRIRRPLRYCDTNPLSLLTLSSPFIPVPIQKVLIDIIMKFQHDYYFKNGFSQLITILYPPLKLLYCRHYGLSGETIFRTTVQVYTANSIVELMSTPIGIKKRLLTEVGLPSPYYAQQQQGGVNDGMKYLQITNMLMSVFYTVLKDVGCPTNADFLNHHSIRTHRLSMICRDLEYVTTDPYYCIELLRGHINCGTMELWIDVCSLIQYIDRMRRQVTIHVEHEDEKWQYAANLLLEVESVSEHFIANAFLQSSSNTVTTTTNTRQQYFPSVNLQQMEDIRSEALLITIEKVMKGIIHWYHTKQYNVSDPSTEQKMVIKFPSNEPGYELTTTSYLVSINSFSIHIPLHRLFMKLFHFACQGNVSCTIVLNRLAERFSEREILLLMDYPLRCLVFFSQVNHGLWKRNGIAPMNLAYNYQRIPLNRTLHDMDILSLQITSLLLKDNNIKSFYLFYFQRYELLDWLLSSSSYRINQESMLILSDLLRVLLQVIIYLPVILFPSSSTSQRVIEGEDVEGVRLALRREVFHQILLGNTSISSLGKLKKLIGTYGTVSDQLLREVLNDLTTSRRITGGASAAMGLGKSKDDDIPAASAGGGGEGQAGTIQLKEESYQYYDPEFPSLTSKQVIQAMDVMKERFKQHKGNNNLRQEKIHWNSINYHNNPYLPLIYEKAIPIAHPDFLPLRQKLLFSTTFLEITYRIITHLCLGNSTGATNDRIYSNRTTLLGRTIELFTVQCYLLPSSSSSMNISNEVQAYLKNFNLYHVGYNVIDQLLKVYNENILKEEEIYQEGLAFLLYQSQYWSTDIRNLLITSNFISVDENKEGGNDTVSSIAQNQKEDEKERLRKAAQERLLAQTKARAENAMKAFADLMSSDSEDDEEDDEKDEDEDEDEEDNDKEEGITQRKRRAILKKTTSLPQEVCIICKQKREDSSLGYLCFIQPSNALKHVTTQYYCHPTSSTLNDDTTSSPYSSINTLYRVVALDGCEIHNLPSETSAVVTVIPYNSHVTVGARQGVWFEILTPVRGFGMIYKESNNAVETNPLTSTVVKNGLNMMNRTLSLNYTPILAPLKSLLYEKNGGTRLHISTCTHAMHFDCWDQFYTAAYARFINHERGAEYQGYDVAKGECLCPLCKNILNSILPILPDVTAVSTNKKKGSTKKKKSQSDDDSAMDVVTPAVLPPPISTPSTLIKQRSVSDYVTSFFQALNLSSLSTQVTTWGSNTSNSSLQKAKKLFVLSEEDRTKIIRFLDGVHTSSSSMISFPPTINTLTPFRSTIRSLGMTGNSASQLAYESFVNRFLFGDWKILQSSMMMISSFAYTLSFSSYLNLANYLNASTLTQINSSGDSWLLSNAEQKLLPQMVTVLQRFSSLFHVYSSAYASEDDDDNSVEETLENPIYTACYQSSLLNLFFCSSKQGGVMNTTAFPPELLHCLRLFPSFPLIYNLQTAYPDMKTFYDILLQLCHQIAAEKGTQATSSETGVPYEVATVLSEYYEVFSSPLLSQDLTVVLIALIPILFQQQSSSEGEQEEGVEGETEDRKRWKCLREFSQMLLLAKINQILIDPKITQIFQHSSQYYQSSPKDNKARTTPTEDTILHDEGLRSIYSQLTSLQRDIYSILQLPSSLLSSNYNDSNNNSNKIIGNVLLKEIFQSLIPFLEVLYRFHQLLSVNIYDEDDHEGEKQGLEGNDRIYGSYDDVKAARSLISMDSTKISLEEKNLHYYQYISYLLKELGLNHLLIILSKIEYIELMKLWNQSYHQYHIQGTRNNHNNSSSSNDEGIVDTVRVNAKNTVNWLPVMDGIKEDQIFQSIDPISALKPLPPSANPSESHLGGSRKLDEGEGKEKGDSQLLQLLQQSTASYMTSSSANEALMERDDEEEEEDGDPRGDDIGVLMDQLIGANPTVAPNGLEELIMQLLQREQRLRQGRGEEEEEEEDDQMELEDEEDETEVAAGRDTTNNNNVVTPAAAPPTGNEGGGLFAALLGRFRATLNPNPTPAPAANPPPTNNAGTGRRGLPSLPAITRGRANSNNSISSSQSRQAPKKPAIPAWPYYGVLPTHAFFDELTGKNYPHQTFLKQLAQSSLTKNPLTSSVTGHYPILTFNLTSSDDSSSMIDRVPLQYPDFSHFNINLDCLQYLYQRNTFIDLPPLYIDLYHMAKFPEGSDGVTLENPAICLLCGQILCAGRKKNTRSQPDAENPGECTLHAMSCGAGIGAFFIIQACNVLIMRGSRSSYHSTIYLDEHNESNADTNVGYGHNKPMFLSSKRYQKVKELYLQHVMAKEITRKRVHADNVIRQYWY